MKIHHAANGITTIYQRARPEYHFGCFCTQWIDTDDILQVTAPVNGIVHANTIDHQ